ncbi:MAG: LssY C-terminal domain-containing protein [Proteobacteria bacterium]|nr:LssY C-terminal domain-containing protein [Pseudomonadota bacterium]
MSMEHFLQPLMDYLRDHTFLGIVVTFFAAFLESLPILGTIVPGSITMTAIGALIGSGVLPPYLTIFFGILGAFTGDYLGFWVGSRYHDAIRNSWPLNRLKKYIQYGERFFVKHGGKSIIIGRFIGPTRAAMPLIAGILRFSWKKFIPVALVASILWSLAYMAPGILLGALAMEFSKTEMSKVLLYGIITIVILWLVFWLGQHFFKQVSKRINRFFQYLWNRLNQNSTGWFVKLIRNQQHPHDFHQIKKFSLAVLFGFLFLLIWLDVAYQGPLSKINQPLFYFLQSFRSDRSDKVWTLLTILGTPLALLAASFLASIGLAWYRHRRSAVHLFLVGIISAAAVELIKKIYFSARPAGLLIVDKSSSFPSGHTTESIAILGFMAFLTARTIPKKWRNLSYTLFCLVIFLISFSRLILGQHWLTDILAAWCLGLSILLLVTVSYRRTPSHRSILKMNLYRWGAIALISAGIPWIISGITHYNTILQTSQISRPEYTLNQEQWWQQPTLSVPLFRADRFGQLSEPFNVQWAGKLEDIQAFLIDHHWEMAVKQSRVSTTLSRFTSHEPEYNVPLLPRLYRNQPPALFFIKRIPNSRDILELRLWQSGITLSPQKVPLWLGVLTYHIPPNRILKFANRYFHLQSSKVLIYSSSHSDGSIFQIVNIAADQQPEKIRKQNWDGDVFVIYTIPSPSKKL